MADPVGGLLDGFLKVGFDYKKFIGDPDLRTGIEKIASALKNSVTSPLNLDDKIIDGMVVSLEAWLDSLKTQHNPLVVGVAAPVPLTAADAANYAAHIEYSQGVVLSQDVKDKLAANPEVIRLLKHKSERYQAKLLASPWFDTLLQWLKDYGPMIAQFLMILLPLFL